MTTDAWNAVLLDEEQARRLVARLKRIPAVRTSYRRLKNGHRVAAACKPANRGRRRGW